MPSVSDGLTLLEKFFALFALIGQGILAVLPGVDRQHNFFYLMLKTIASPAWRVAW